MNMLVRLDITYRGYDSHVQSLGFMIKSPNREYIRTLQFNFGCMFHRKLNGFINFAGLEFSATFA